jgi:hypothetical protein
MRGFHKRRLWLTDGSCIGLRPAHRNHVWSYDWIEERIRLISFPKRRYRVFPPEHTCDTLI